MGIPKIPSETSRESPKGNTFTGTNTSTGFTYDTYGDLVEVSDPDGNVRSISYNVNGDQVGTRFAHYDGELRPTDPTRIRQRLR